MSQVVIELENINKTYTVSNRRMTTIREHVINIFSRKSSKKMIRALSDINLKVNKGETVGIIGRNGSGKSTLMNIILGAIKPDRGGVVNTSGKIIKLSLGIGVDKQLTAIENIYLNGSILGLSFKEIGERVDDMLKFAGIEEFKDTQVKYYSKGMKSRLLFAIAMHAEADIFLLDEFFGGVGDEEFKRKSGLVFNKSIVEGKTIVMISHSLKTIADHADKVIWIEKGKIKAVGNPKEVIKLYKESFN